MNKMLRILGVLLVLMIVVGLAAVLAGCGKGSASGGAGGQAIVLNLHQNAPPGPVVPPAMPDVTNLEDLPRIANSEKAGAGNLSIVNIHIVDGGTLTGNPTVGLDKDSQAEPAPAATTQPTQ